MRTTPCQPIGNEDGQYLGDLTKKCPKCGEVKPLESYSWAKKGVSRVRICKPCAAFVTRQWRADNPGRCEEVRKSKLEKYHANPEPTREKAKQWYAENLEQARASRKAWYEANTDHVAKLDKARRTKYPEKFKEWNRQWRANNPERSRYHRRKYKLTHAEHVKSVNRVRVLARYDEVVAKQREWALANPDRVSAISKRWRDRNPGYWLKRKLARVTPAWASRAAIRSVYREAARLSRAEGKPFDVDHIYPVQGKTVCGLHTPANLRPMEARANRSKGNKLPGHLEQELWGSV